MKIRVGFVSNSSSSSFAIIGKIYGLDEITELLEKWAIKNKKEISLNKWDLEDSINECFDLDTVYDSENCTFIIGERPRISDKVKEKISSRLKEFDPQITKVFLDLFDS